MPRRHSGAPGRSAVSRSPVCKPRLPRKRRCTARAAVPRGRCVTLCVTGAASRRPRAPGGGVRASLTAAPPHLTLRRGFRARRGRPTAAWPRAKRQGSGAGSWCAGGCACCGRGSGREGFRRVGSGVAVRGVLSCVCGAVPVPGGESRRLGSSGRFAACVQPRQSGTEFCGAPGARRGPAREAQLRAAAAWAAFDICVAAEAGGGRRASPSQSFVVWGTAFVPRGRSVGTDGDLLPRVLGCCSCTGKVSRTGAGALEALWLLLGGQRYWGSGGAWLPAVSFRGWNDGSSLSRWGRLTLGTSFPVSLHL